MEIIRDDLRKILEQEGFGDGLPKEGDRVQSTEVRLVQALLKAFEDPDYYFCEWWARGVWLGSMKRKLPRTLAVLDRKTKWRWVESTEKLHGERQENYSSPKERTDTVQS